MLAPQANDQMTLELIDILQQIWQALMTLASALLMVLVGIFTIVSAIFTLLLGSVRLVLLGLFALRVLIARLQGWCAKQASTPLPFR